MDNSIKNELIKKHSPRSSVLKNSARAFIIGGVICAMGELLLKLYLYLGIEEKISFTLVTLSFILLSALLTGFGIFDRIARYAGAGTLVPVTGFANAVVSEAMDSGSEGIVLGVGSKIFTVAGPVILFGISAGSLYGILYYLYTVITAGI